MIRCIALLLVVLQAAVPSGTCLCQFLGPLCAEAAPPVQEEQPPARKGCCCRSAAPVAENDADSKPQGDGLRGSEHLPPVEHLPSCPALHPADSVKVADTCAPVTLPASSPINVDVLPALRTALDSHHPPPFARPLYLTQSSLLL